MFDIGFFELLLVGIVGLVVIGPERLPDAVRTTVRWWNQIKNTLASAKDELEREVGADEIRRELHNERVLKELRESQEEMERNFKLAEQKFEQDLKKVRDQAEQSVDVEAEQRREAEDYLPEQDQPEKLADDYLPEQEEDDSDLEDPEYPEHLHDHGDPEFNPHHPEHFQYEEEIAHESDAETPELGSEGETGSDQAKEDKRS